jgi:hypothetical protein
VVHVSTHYRVKSLQVTKTKREFQRKYDNEVGEKGVSVDYKLKETVLQL